MKIQDFKVGELGSGGKFWDGKLIIAGEVKGVEIGEGMWGIE